MHPASYRIGLGCRIRLLALEFQQPASFLRQAVFLFAAAGFAGNGHFNESRFKRPVPDIDL